MGSIHRHYSGKETGLVSLNDFIEGETFAVEAVEGGKKQMVIVEARDRKLSPHIEIINDTGKILAWHVFYL